MYITYSEFVSVALVSQHAMNMRPGILSVVCLALPYFSTLSHKMKDLRKKMLLNTKCILIFSTTSVRNIPRIIKGDLTNVHKFHADGQTRSDGWADGRRDITS